MPLLETSSQISGRLTGLPIGIDSFQIIKLGTDEKMDPHASSAAFGVLTELAARYLLNWQKEMVVW